jgi:hypothetical protein
MPENRRMFWKVRATLASAVDLEIGIRSSRNSSAVLGCQRHHAFGRLVEAGDAVEHRRLAGAIRADQRGDLAALGFKLRSLMATDRRNFIVRCSTLRIGSDICVEPEAISRVLPWTRFARDSLAFLGGTRLAHACRQSRAACKHDHHHREAEHQHAVSSGVKSVAEDFTA